MGLATLPVAVAIAPAVVVVALVVPGVIVLAVGLAPALVLLGVLPGVPIARTVPVAILVAEGDAARRHPDRHVGGGRRGRVDKCCGAQQGGAEHPCGYACVHARSPPIV